MSGDELEVENSRLRKKLAEAEATINRYEQDGPAKLFYAMRRKSNEMADLLNNYELGSTDVPMDDPKNKVFDRLKIIWIDAKEIAEAIKTLGEIAGVTGNKEADTERRLTYHDLLAEDRS